MIKQEDVTIIIPHLGATREQQDALLECMISLEETFSGPIIIATNGKSWEENRSAKYSGLIGARGQYQHLHFTKQGQCMAVNAAVATVNTPWVFITNDDMIYAPGWFDELALSDANPKTLCVSSKLVEPREGAPTFLTHFCGGAGGDFDKKKFLEFVASQPMASWKDSHKNGFNFPVLIKKELWDLVGGYDVNYDPWGSNSDSDLEYKIRLAGIQPLQAQHSLVYHFSQTSGTFEPKNRPSWERNWQYFIDKWGFPRTDDGIWEATFVIPSREEGRLFNPDWERYYKK